MPALGADMDFGTITDWRVKPGDTVKKGDIVAIVETQKATMEVEIFQSGVIDQIVVPPGTRVPVGTVLALLRDGGGNGQAPSPAAVVATPTAIATPTAVPSITTTPVAQPVAGERPRVSAPGASSRGRDRCRIDRGHRDRTGRVDHREGRQAGWSQRGSGRGR